MATFRPINILTDAADLARLYSYTSAEGMTPGEAREWWTLSEGEIRVSMLALDENCRAIGYWDVDYESWRPVGHFYLKVIVAPEERGRGLGARMYTDALRMARQQGTTHLRSSVREGDSASLKFAERRGFRVEHHTFVSTLDLADFEEHRFDDLRTRVHEEGFRFFSLAEAGVTDENKRKLYEVNCVSGLDNPGNNGTFPDFDTFSKNVFDASWFRADTQILASYHDRWVGLSAIGIYPEDQHAYNAFTGVLRKYRGRGLAQALKLQTIRLAKQKGMRYVRTDNDSKNGPMLAVNRRLGYQPEPGYYRLLCVLDKN